ncbi:phage holin family protein [Desulforamulus aquiferis]|uniref:Phage holin family protein n=1 Tax=Desulforamulus aquiferis TaxID=1397668 RepID=A0AAW7ZE26_9FIRM|nr:phage holin family protein [Desulforamulus aquiferis]MDO7787510.1 phage holin family protein [Desulforamulus aquiferis]RYD01550.1 hypothetical protein N752_29220 [Desulforamulus aquiferis]
MREFGIKATVASISTVATYLFGGWSPTLELLVFMVVIDYITGLYAAYSQGQLSSQVGFCGIAKKLFIFLLIAVAHKMDMAFDSPGFLRNLITYFYIANEGLSMLENMARAGMAIPEPLKAALIQIKNEAEKYKSKE